MEHTTTHEDPRDPNLEDESSTAATSRPRWERPREGRMVAGVGRMLAERSGLPAWLIRTAFVLAALAGGFGLAAYIALVLITPAADAVRSPADEWVHRYRNAAGPNERAGLILVAAAIVLALMVVGLPTSPLMVPLVLLIVGMTLMRPPLSDEPA